MDTGRGPTWLPSAAMPRQAAEESRRTPAPARGTLPPPSVAASPTPLRLLDERAVGKDISGDNRGDRRLRRSSARPGGSEGGGREQARGKGKLCQHVRLLHGSGCFLARS